MLALQFFIGLMVGLYSYLFPSYINLACLDLGMKARSSLVIKVILVIAAVEIPYCMVCMNVMQWLLQKTAIVQVLRWLIVIVLLVLACMTIWQAYSLKPNTNMQQTHKPFMSIRSLLLFAIFNPFQLSAWTIWGAYFIEKSWFVWSPTAIFMFSLGAAIGVYIILFLYARIGNWLVQHLKEHERLIKYSIGFILLLLACVQILQVM